MFLAAATGTTSVLEVVVVLIIVAIGFIAVEWILAAMGIVIPRVLLILIAVLIVLLVLSGALHVRLGAFGQ